MANIIYAFPCRRGCGMPATEGKSCCSKKCRDSLPTCKVTGCTNAPEPITYQGHDYAGYTQNCYLHGGRHNYEGEDIDRPPKKYPFVKTVKGWLQCA